MSRSEVLKRLAHEEGFELVGICSPGPSEHTDFFQAWIGDGRHGSMSYMARPDALARRADLRHSLPEARAVLVVGHNYHQEDPDEIPGNPDRGVIARYARGRDYHKVVRRGLERIHRRFSELEGAPVAGRVYVDTGPVLERELGARAGLGWFGRNTMLIHPRRGSYFFLGVLLLGVDVEPDEPIDRDHCGTCRACLDACPTSALLGRDPSGAPVMDATRCISYLTIEHRGPIPLELRPLIGNRVYGCDICQEVCPFNESFAAVADEPAYAARAPGRRPHGVEAVAESEGVHPGTESPRLTELIEMSEEAWDSFSRGSPIRRAGRSGFLRNVAVALGNWGSREALPALTRALSDVDALVRGHAAWGLGRVGSTDAHAALTRRLETETDPSVREEIERALGGETAAD